jgi:hypothetical protein
MAQKRKLNLLNGQAMYDYFKMTHFLKEETIVPFNEAMCYGATTLELFSDEFTLIRAKVHHITPEQYSDITLKPLKPFFNKDFDHLALWFDEDMFCQINVLTILAWLDMTNFKNIIELNIVGDDFEIKERFTLKAEGYYSIYNQVLIQKLYPSSPLPAPLNKGVELYLSYLKKNSELTCYIQRFKNVPERELVPKLIKNFKKYGLGDTQYLEMIKANRT